jgi:uncharacterized secreted repeat protein (TIGR03808 family)
VTGNVVENARDADIIAGWGNFLRDVAVTGNVVRQAGIGVGVSVVAGSGSALISSNVITGFRRAAILGMDHARPVTGELAKEDAQPHAHLSNCGKPRGIGDFVASRREKTFIARSSRRLVQAK